MTTESPNPAEDRKENEWMIRPCHMYKEEHSECTSIKGRFHQYFIHGENIECAAWKQDFVNCKLWHSARDETAFNELVASEQKRRMERLRPHYANTVWKKRTAPPEDWNKPLPEWMVKENAVSFLAIKAAELQESDSPTVKKQLCTIS